MPLDKDVYLGAIEQEGQLLLAAADGNLGGIIPACPGWTVQTVLVHVARVYRSVAEHVATGATDMIRYAKTPSPDSFEVVSWVRESQAMVLDALGNADPAQPVWTWSDDKTAGFYQRRMAHETAMHRYDVEAATGTPTPFDGDIATDGIAEFYEVVMPFNLARREVTLPSGSLHLHRSDGEGEWMITAVDGAVAVTNEHGKGDAAVRGPASDLFVFAWHRGMPATLQIFGDEAVARAWAALAP
ncbi:MAG TPA: maleylpyruvate isomerase family mycothiol-dependent enzyme [Acidimicrobiales bacterium]|nr:maleylpyruvate isomerase family mycothiol-dependent enzyme [Acidimicrobiales bacterium]